MQKSASTQGTRVMPELEAYRLDCAQSNVSPDSGIQSVPGSPVNESTQRDSTPPVLRPVTPPERNVRKRGRPKKYRDVHNKKPAEDQCGNVLVSSKRGPGRPKKTPILGANLLERHDSHNLNFMLNEICERVNRGLELPSKGGSRAIEIKELERIISDHKTSKARNSKIDALFSKSKKLSSVPNIAIVKPMQHHILNEKRDDDEKQNKRGGRRGKLDKFDELVQIKPEDISDEKLEKPSKERRKSERDKKPIVPAKANPRPNRSRTRHLSSGTEGSCDKSLDSDLKKPKVDKIAKKVIKVGCNGAAVKAPCAVNYVQPMPRKVVQKKRPKYLSVRHSLLHHRHRRKKSKKSKAAEKTRLDYAWFKIELEKIINDFQKCYIGKKVLPTAPVAPTKIIAPVSPAEKITEPRIKRLGKKRKNVDKKELKETAVEKLKLSEAVDDGKEKPKRKQKKVHNEVQGQAEANPNEQRLPLKKRHYHLTSESQATVKEVELPKQSLETDRPRESVDRILRSSVEDTIEATISRFSNLETGQCSVIVTPKKRHRPEDDDVKTKVEPGGEGLVVAGQLKRRSSSLNKERDKKLMPKVKKSDKVLRSVRKLIDADDPSKTEPLHIDLPLLEAVKVECPNSDSLEMATLTPITEIKQESKGAKLPVAGIFEPSDNAVEIDNSILVPLNSPSELVNNLKGSLSLKMIKQNDSDHGLRKIDKKSRKIDKNQKAIENMKTVRVNLDALTSSELLTNGVRVNKKVRRRKVINRTGFPTSKKKKKKKPVEDVKTVIASVDETKPTTESPCENSNLSDKPLSELKTAKIVENSPTETDDEVPLKQKISLKIEQKLNAGRVIKKSGKKIKAKKIERTLRPKEEVEAPPVEPVKVVPPVRKRKLANTIKNTKSKMKSRYQLPLLSMKKFKKAKLEEKVPSEDEAVDVVEAKKKAQPRWRKKYLPAGLLSDYYKVDYKDKPLPKLAEKSFNKLAYHPNEHEHGLMPAPAYCNKFLRLRKEDFLLPYDIWWLHSNNQLPSRGDVPSWNYKKIRTSKSFLV